MGIDLIGSGEKTVALVELDGKSKKNAKSVAESIVRHNKNVKTVIAKVPGMRGKYRMNKRKIIWGDKNTEVLHKEHGYLLKVDPMKMYFSPRESTIRQYISSQVRPKEKILVMFAGIGPYAISIAKTQPKVGEIVAVEWNPQALKFMEENVRINKVSHLVTPVKGAVETVCKKFGPEFDRVIMPMVKSGDFLELAANLTKKSGKIDAYMVSEKDESFDDSKKFVAKVFKKLKKRYELKGARKISLYAPGKWKILMEIEMK